MTDGSFVRMTRARGRGSRVVEMRWLFGAWDAVVVGLVNRGGACFADAIMPCTVLYLCRYRVGVCTVMYGCRARELNGHVYRMGVVETLALTLRQSA